MTNPVENPLKKKSFESEADPFPDTETSLTGDKRTEARLCAVQAVSQHLLMGEDLPSIQQQFVQNQLKKRKAEAKVFNAILNAVTADITRFKTMLEPNFTKSFTWETADPVQKAILLCAVAEWHTALKTPPKVVLNEFLNISKGFCPPSDTDFLNAVLDKMMQQVVV